MNRVLPTSSGVTVARQSSAHLAHLLRQEYSAMIEFLLALVEFDGRRLWEDLGFGSLFDYLHRELEMPVSSAFYRSTAARLLHSFPEVVEPLREGRLCISSLHEVAKVLTRENWETVLPQFFGRSAREAKEVAAALLPNAAPPRRDVVTSVAPPTGSLTLALDRAAPTQEAEPVRSTPCSVGGTQSLGVCPIDLPSAPARTPSGEPRAVDPDRIEPLTADLRRLHLTVSREFLRKLEAARSLMSHRHPSGRAEDVLGEALDLLLDRHIGQKSVRRRKVTAEHRRELLVSAEPGTTHKPAAGPTRLPGAEIQAAAPLDGRSERIPASVRRAVLERDEGRCQFKLHDGTICGSTVRIEVDHAIPRSMNGPPTLANLRVLCRAHNELVAAQFFGEGWMDQFGRGRARSRRPGTGDALAPSSESFPPPT